MRRSRVILLGFASQAGILGHQPLSIHRLRHRPTMIPMQSLHQNLEGACYSGLMLSKLNPSHSGNLHLSGIQESDVAPHAEHFRQRQLKLHHSHDPRLSGIQDVFQGRFCLPVVSFGACWRLVFSFIALASQPLIVNFCAGLIACFSLLVASLPDLSNCAWALCSP